MAASDGCPDATLVLLVQALANIDLGPLSIVPITTGKHNRSFRVQASDRQFILRIAPPDTTGLLFYERHMMRQEPSLHSILLNHTSLPVARVVGHDFSRARIDRDYLLLEMLPGTPLSEAYWLPAPARSRTLEQVGGYLRQLHSLTAQTALGCSHYGYLGEHHPLEPEPTWEAAFAAMWNRLLDNVVDCRVYSQAEGQVFRELFEAHRAHFRHPVSPCLLHMDVWDQNILVDRDGNVTGLVDFDRALWGDPEIEYAVLDYCSVSEPAFWSGYGQPRDTSPAAEIRRLFYLLYEVQKYMPISVWRRADRQGAERYKDHSFRLASELLRRV